ncbi:MAG: hypothetical protein A3D57_00655 [Candidatus Sungbacteria bacterium RIFCSPHIGHO2_02_FULL_46_12]|nr:MAG: hypothetical protein A3D57_00655 [Candidatus Sungbacteria bacterium RIFCSPHIGHO2_02_FULL_46_12]
MPGDGGSSWTLIRNSLRAIRFKMPGLFPDWRIGGRFSILKNLFITIPCLATGARRRWLE